MRDYRAGLLLRELKLNRELPEGNMQRWKRELEEHLVTGVFNPAMGLAAQQQQLHVNPTLFWRPDQYDLHYGTCSFAAFRTVLPCGAEKLVDACRREFQSWAAGAQRHRARVSWRFDSRNAHIFLH
jgi:hypothetical protein